MNTAAVPAVAVNTGSLSYLPVALFGSVMGLCGLAVGWTLAHQLYGAPRWAGALAGALAVLAFIALAVGYGVKALTGFATVRAEFNHPIAGNLFGTALISILLLPILIAPYSMAFARGLWVLGAVGMTLFAWLIVNRWLHRRQNAAHATPA